MRKREKGRNMFVECVCVCICDAERVGICGWSGRVGECLDVCVCVNSERE